MKKWFKDLFSNAKAYRLNADSDSKQLIIEKYYDRYANSMPTWWNLEPPQEVVDKVVEESRKYTLEYDQYGKGLLFNRELLDFYEQALADYEAKVIQENKSTFENLYQQ